jgi:hypothetical protein
MVPTTMHTMQIANQIVWSGVRFIKARKVAASAPAFPLPAGSCLMLAIAGIYHSV